MQLSRLEAFSDGVFAIAITLLVLGIEVPPSGAGLGSALLRLWPAYVAYAVSFLLLGAIWINHHAMLVKFRAVDGAILVLNLLHLMVVAFLPFATAVLAGAFLSGEDQDVAAAFYGAVLAVGGVFVNALWWYGMRAGLLRPSVSAATIARATRRYAMGPVLYAFAAVVSFLLPPAAILVYAFLIAFYLLWPAVGHRPAGLSDSTEQGDA